MDNDSNPLQLVDTDEEVSPTASDQTFHSTLEELDPSSQSPEEEMEEEKEPTPALAYDLLTLPNTSPNSRGSSSPRQRPNPPTYPRHPDHAMPTRNMPRSSERRHLQRRIPPPRVGFQWASREEIAALREYYDGQDEEKDTYDGKKEAKEGEQGREENREEIKKHEVEVKRPEKEEIKTSELDFFDQEDGEWDFFGEDDGEEPRPRPRSYPQPQDHFRPTPTHILTPPNPYLPPYHSQDHNPSPQSQHLASYPFPSPWTTACTDSLTALGNFTAASSTYFSSLAESGLGRAGRSLGSAVVFSAREGVGGVRRILSQESGDDQTWAAEQIRAVRRMLEREGR